MEEKHLRRYGDMGLTEVSCNLDFKAQQIGKLLVKIS
jgi:hypothetical protein